MNEYSKIRNAHDRAVILAQLVKADALAMWAFVIIGDDFIEANRNYDQSRAELWKIIGPSEEEDNAG